MGIRKCTFVGNPTFTEIYIEMRCGSIFADMSVLQQPNTKQTTKLPTTTNHLKM